MELEFRTDENARKMLLIWQGISRLPYALRSAPVLFGDDFYKKTLLYEEMADEKGAPNALFEEILSSSAKR